MNTVKNCPICANSQFEIWLKTKDYFLTKENFDLFKCSQCGLVITHPFPYKKDAEKYYQSDEYFSHPEKKKNIIAALYDWVKQRNIKYKYRQATSGLNPGRILDIGCGAGDFLTYAQSKGWEVCGIEPNEKAKTHSEKRLNAKIFKPEEIVNFNNNTFDVVTLWHVLEHIEDLNEQIGQLKRILKPQGRVIIALPNLNSADAHHYREFWAAYDVPRHLYHFSFKNIRELMQKHQFRFLKREPLKWDAYYIALLSERYKNGKQRPLFAALRGLISNLQAKKTREYSSNIYIFYAES